MEKFLIALLLGFGLGLFISVASPLIYRHYRPKKSQSGKNKIMVDRPAMILIFVVLIAATALSWQTTRYNVSGNEGATDNQYVDKPYPVYNSQYDLLKVVDQNTLDVDSNGKSSRIKLIGTGQFTGGNAEQNSCFAKEADARLAALLSAKKIELEADVVSTASDNDDVLPRYVVVGDENINKKMIAEGYAVEATGAADYRYRADFLAAQENAKTNRLGFWSGSFCPIKTEVAKSPANTNKPTGSSGPSATQSSSNPQATPGSPQQQPPGPACPNGVPVITPLLNGLLNRC